MSMCSDWNISDDKHEPLYMMLERLLGLASCSIMHNGLCLSSLMSRSPHMLAWTVVAPALLSVLEALKVCFALALLAA